MTDLRVIGLDPGPTPGLVLLDYVDVHASMAPTFFPKWELYRLEALQCTAGLIESVLSGFLYGPTHNSPSRPKTQMVAAELFITGNRTHRSSTPAAGRQTAEMVELIRGVCAEFTVPCYLRRATDVKPWATANHDARLAASGLLEPTKGMTHTRSAAWHALFCAVHDGGVPDPLSRTAR